MSKWLCTICHLLGAFLLYHIYSIISWRDFKNHVKNRFWQSEIDFLQPRWGALETVSCKFFYFPDVKTRAQRSRDQSETELYPGQRLCATPPPHAELFASCACAEDAPVSVMLWLCSSSRPSFQKLWNGSDSYSMTCHGNSAATPSWCRHNSLAICYTQFAS